MISDTTPKEVEDLKERGRELLRRENTAYKNLTRRRPVAAMAAREYGLTNQEIADIYGVTEGAVRALIKRAGK